MTTRGDTELPRKFTFFVSICYEIITWNYTVGKYFGFNLLRFNCISRNDWNLTKYTHNDIFLSSFGPISSYYSFFQARFFQLHLLLLFHVSTEANFSCGTQTRCEVCSNTFKQISYWWISARLSTSLPQYLSDIFAKNLFPVVASWW